MLVPARSGDRAFEVDGVPEHDGRGNQIEAAGPVALIFKRPISDLTTASGRALAGMLAVFAEFERDILRDRVKAGIAQARQDGRPHGRPVTVRRHADDIRKLHQEGVSKSEIARRLSVSRTSVRRLLEP